MKSYSCPSCGKPAFSYWQKHFLGPARSTKCSLCGARVSVPWLRSTVFGLPVMFAPLIFGFGAVWLAAPARGATLFVFVSAAVLTAIPLLWLYDRYVPLVSK